jgi:hypothetical protein
MLYRVRVGRDEYLGTAEEVVRFMAQAEGAPGSDPASYMRGVAARVSRRLGISGVVVASAEEFLESLARRGVLRVEPVAEPRDERVSREEALGDGPLVMGRGVTPDDIASLDAPDPP